MHQEPPLIPFYLGGKPHELKRITVAPSPNIERTQLIEPRPSAQTHPHRRTQSQRHLQTQT